MLVMRVLVINYWHYVIVFYVINAMTVLQTKEAATATASANQLSALEKKIEELEKENKELKETGEAQKASITASENKMTEMKKTMKIAMQRFSEMKSMDNIVIV